MMTVRPRSRVLGVFLQLATFLWLGFPWLGVLIPPAAAAEGGAGESIDRAVKRFDPGRLALVTVQSPLPGKIYSHYSDHLKRRVWAFARPDGSFSHALGEGSTQNTKRFDFPYSTIEQQEMIAKVAPRWAKSMQQVGSEVYVRLNRENSWKLVQHLTVPSIYDLETRYRWEWHGNRRVVVGHTTGYRWRVENGRYLPESVGSYGLVTAPPGCAPCARVGGIH